MKTGTIFGIICFVFCAFSIIAWFHFRICEKKRCAKTKKLTRTDVDKNKIAELESKNASLMDLIEIYERML